MGNRGSSKLAQNGTRLGNILRGLESNQSFRDREFGSRTIRRVGLVYEGIELNVPFGLNPFLLQ